MSPRTTAELENTWDARVTSAFVTDISSTDLLITDEGADASALDNLKADGLVVDAVRSRIQ